MRRWSDVNRWAQIATILALPVAILAIILPLVLDRPGSPRPGSSQPYGMPDTSEKDIPTPPESEPSFSREPAVIPTDSPSQPVEPPPRGRTGDLSYRLIYDNRKMTLKPPYCSNYFIDFDEPDAASSVEESELEFVEVDCGLAPSPYLLLGPAAVAGIVSDRPTSRPNLDDCHRILNTVPRSDLESLGSEGAEVCFTTGRGRIVAASFRSTREQYLLLTLTAWEQEP